MNIKKLIFYDGLEKSKYESVKNELYEQNRKNLVLYSGVVSIFFGVLFTFSSFSPVIGPNRYVYLGCTIASVITFLLIQFVAKRRTSLIIFLNYVYLTIVYTFAILVGTVIQPQQLAVSMCVCGALVPFLSYDIVARSAIFRAVMTIIFCIVAIFVKPREVYTVDIINVIGYGLVGSVGNVIIQKVQTSAFYLRYNLKREVAERTQVIKDLSHESLMAFATAIDAKDSYTNGHSLRVADYSRLIASKMGKSKKEQEDIYYVALLHDVGKIGIPDGIINKPGKLTDEEYIQIKKHPTTGYNILKNIEKLPQVAVGAKYHHERYDGKGYPEGIGGDDIPEIARIIAVADAYDAMTSTRSYRATMSQEEVYNEIKEGKGTQFDPKIAQIMLVIIENDKQYKLHG